MNNGVAARIETPTFVEALRMLRVELNLSPDQLVTFMSIGVAARIETPTFVEALQTLRAELNMSPEHLVTFMSDSPSGLNDALENMLGELALAAFDALAGSGWGRVDFMQDKLGRFYLLEANTVPGMTEKSLLPMAAKKAGLTFAELSVSVLATADVLR